MQFGTEMRLTRVSEAHFTAHTNAANGGIYYDTDLRHRDGRSWYVRIVKSNDPTVFYNEVENEVSVEGPRLTFSSGFGNFVWEWIGP